MDLTETSSKLPRDKSQRLVFDLSRGRSVQTKGKGKGKGKRIDIASSHAPKASLHTLYSGFVHSKRSDMDHTVLPANYTIRYSVRTDCASGQLTTHLLTPKG